MDKKSNGSYTNGSGQHEPKPSKIVQFPSLAERDRLRREQEKAEQLENHEPFFKFGNIPLFTKLFMTAILVVSVPLFLWPDSALMPWAIYNFGFIPAFFTGQIDGLSSLSYLSPITHMFLHGSWIHLSFNVIMGTALCTFFERSYGTRAALIVSLLCGLAGALLTFLLNPASMVPIIGASGAISGLFGAIILSMHQSGEMGPRSRRFGPWPMLGFWLIFMIVAGLIAQDLAWQAHVGGYLGGIGLTLALQKRLIRL